MLNILLALLAILISIVFNLVISLSVIAPDFQNLANVTLFPLFVGVSLIFPSLFFSLTFSKERHILKYIGKALGLSIVPTGFSLVGLLAFSIYLNVLRCIQTGFCADGEPFTYMSTIFLVLTTAPYLGLFFIVSLVTSLLVYLLFHILPERFEASVSLVTRVLLLGALQALTIFQVYKSVTSFQLESPLQKTLEEVAENCPKYEHCGNEKMNVYSIVENSKSKQVSEKLTNYQRWALALGAVTIEINAMPHDQLSVIRSNFGTDFQIDIAKNLLSEWWGVTNKDTTLETLDWLANEGHSLSQYLDFYLVVKEYPTLTSKQILDKVLDDLTIVLTEEEKAAQIAAFDFVRENNKKTGDNLIYAWDYGRFVFVTRLAYSAGYLNDKEALSLIEEVGKRVNKRFHSWEEFGENYAIGRKWWAPNQPGLEQQTDYTIKKLLQSPTGHWSKIPWGWSEE